MTDSRRNSDPNAPSSSRKPSLESIRGKNNGTKSRVSLESTRNPPSSSRRHSLESIRSNQKTAGRRSSLESIRSNVIQKKIEATEIQPRTTSQHSRQTVPDVRFNDTVAMETVPRPSEKLSQRRATSLMIEPESSDSFQSLEDEEEVLEVEIVHHRDSTVPYNSPRLKLSHGKRFKFLLKSSFMAFFVMLLTHFQVGIIRMM